MPFHPQPAEAVKEQRTESLAEQAESHDAGHADFAKSEVFKECGEDHEEAAQIKPEGQFLTGEYFLFSDFADD